MSTPLYDALKAFAETRPNRFHMPGHHGHPLPIPYGPSLSELDFTELPPTGNLFESGGPIEEAELLWAGAYGMSSCLFLTGGSTQGLLAALALACPPGNALLVDRGCHRSVYHAMALLDLRPVYLPRPWLSEPGVNGPVDPHAVETALRNNPDIKTLCITSPTYYGVKSDIETLSEIVHSHGGKLVVDGAHGAHLPFLGDNPYLKADLLVVSAHKTLPAPGQTALLFSNGTYSMDELRRCGKIFGSSSPSYPMMAALDLCRADMEGEGRARYQRAAEFVHTLRKTFSSLQDTDAPLDPCRFTWCVREGSAVQERLRRDFGIYPEMADTAHVVFTLTCSDSEEERAALQTALAALAGRCETERKNSAVCPALPPFPEQVLSPRAALFSPRRTVALEETEGMVSADQIAPYPPGVPVIAPGERIDKKHLSYLAEVGYNRKSMIGVL